MNIKDEIHFCECKCGETIKWKSYYKHCGWTKFINHHHSKLIKGKTIKERYGKKIADIVSAKINKTKTNKSTRNDYNFICKCGINYILNLTLLNFKRKSYRKHCSQKCANSHNQTKQQNKNRSNRLVKNIDVNIFKNTLENFFKYESNVTKTNFLKNKFVKKEFGIINTIKKNLKRQKTSLDDIAEECGLIFNRKGTGGIGNNEIQILEYYSKINNIQDMDKDFRIGRFKPDATIHRLKQHIEVHEPYHRWGTQPIKDNTREEKISKLTGYEFIRLDEQEWLRKINKDN